MANFEPNEDAIDFYESLEGMLVKLPTLRLSVLIGQVVAEILCSITSLQE